MILDKIFKKSKRIRINDKTKIVIMSDCHRGTGTNYDNFIKNKEIFASALMRYYKNGFTYIELGDGDEMWEVDDYKDIVEEHIDTFKILKRFHDKNRLIMVYGNHDIEKRSLKVLKDSFYHYFNKETKKKESLLNELVVYESLVLEYNGNDIFMIHGHQVDFLNSLFWRVSKFLVKHIWSRLENIGLIIDPTGSIKSYEVISKVEKKLKHWSIRNNKILITGHTHKPIYPSIGESLYFNDGSCIHPSGISCLEIEKGNITLVKWSYQIKRGKYVAVRRVVDGNVAIKDFFK